ncbi:MAG: methyltransferase [Aquificaceae bacterium]
MVRKSSFFNKKLRFYHPSSYRLSIVEILFCDFVRAPRARSRLLDLGAGFGTLSILCSLKLKSGAVAVEKDRLMIDLLNKNISINSLSSHIKVVESDVREPERWCKKGAFDCAVSNPPFFKSGNSPYRAESQAVLADFVSCAGFALRDGGFLNLMIPAFRLFEAFEYMKANNIHPKVVRFMHPKVGSPAKVAFVLGVKNLKPDVFFEKPLIVNKDSGEYTQEVLLCIERFSDIIKDLR